MLRAKSMRREETDHRRRGQRGAALRPAAIFLSGCSPVPPPPEPGDAPATSRFTSLFSGSASPAMQTMAGAPAFSGNNSHSVEVRTGAGTATIVGKPPEASSTGVRYQLPFTELARQCMAGGANL